MCSSTCDTPSLAALRCCEDRPNPSSCASFGGGSMRSVRVEMVGCAFVEAIDADKTVGSKILLNALPLTSCWWFTELLGLGAVTAGN